MANTISNTVKLAKIVHPDFFGEESSSLRPRKLMIAGRYFMPIRMANHPLHPFSLSSACYYYFHSLLTGPVDASLPNHCFTKTAYTQTIREQVPYRLPHASLFHLMRAIARTRGSINATSLMRVTNSTRHFGLWYLLSGTLEEENERKNNNNKFNSCSSFFNLWQPFVSLNVVLQCMTSEYGKIISLEWIL